MSEINDNRLLYDFKGVSFNNIKINEVKKELINCLLNNNCDQALYWTFEILLSCNFIILWDIYFYFMSNIITTLNLKYINFLYKKYLDFKIIINKCEKEKEILKLRLNNNIHNIFSDITTFICCCDKGCIIDYNKMSIKKFNFDKLHNYLKAPNINYINNFFKDNDPKELYIILNELVYNLDEKNELEIYKWIYIYLNYYSNCRKNKITLLCEKRSDLNYINNFNEIIEKHPIWIIWDILLKKSSDYMIYYNYINKLLHFYTIQLNLSKIKSRIHILFFAVKVYLSIFSNNNIIEAPILKNKDYFFNLASISRKSIHNIIKKINQNYIKDNKNNINLKKKEKLNKIDKSFEKLKLLDNFILNKNSNED